MANPFLVLGGIAISVATAAFGILQVPGWVASAQDAAAINDVAQMTQAQAVSMTEKGVYLASTAKVNELGSVKTTRSQGAHVYTAADWTGKHAVTVAKSASGAFFARLGDGSTIGRGDTPEAAVTAAGTTVVDGITAEGVQIPLAQGNGWVLPRNFVPEPPGGSIDGFISTHNAELSVLEDFPGRRGVAIRSTQTEPTLEGGALATVRWVEIQAGREMPFGSRVRFTGTIRLSDPMELDFSLRTNTSVPDTRVLPNTTLQLPAGVSRLDLTFDPPAADATEYSGLTIRSSYFKEGATVDVGHMAFTVDGAVVPVPE